MAKFTWPALASVVAWKLYPTVRDVLRSRAVTIKVGDMEVSVQHLSENLQKDIADLQRYVSELRAEQQPGLAQLAPPPPVPTLKVRSAGAILWVDDNPENNAVEIVRFEQEGYDVVTVTSTSAALKAIQNGRKPFGVVITDMARQEGRDYNDLAGIDLTNRLRQSHTAPPVIVYTVPGRVSRIRDQVLEAGAEAITGSPLELAELVRTILLAA